ncbi:MAG: transporter ATP-binding protein [Rhodospirillales bacterium]|jgi:peptide/nickel transport system ATP-binding protein|nr:transporter ATP-binding protein [Rhodospirillales bacterium]
MTTKTKVIDVQNLQVNIDVPAGTLHAVSGISFHVNQGETLCIVGESGCGKSITALALMNLLPKKAKLTADKLELQGRDMTKFSEAEFATLRGDRIAMIFQDPMTSLNPVYRVGDQLEEVYIHHGKGGRKEASERAEFLLEKVGISAPKSRLIQYPHQLSGGLRQRIMIAMTLMCDPALIIADEPTTALDVTIQAQILNTLRNLQKEFKTAMILITHDLGVVARVADQVAVMYAGKFVETGSAMEVFQQPTHPYTQGLIACIPKPGMTGHGRLGSIPGIVPSLVGDMEGCLFRNRCASIRPECEVGAETPLNMLSEGRGYRCVMSVEECMKRAQVEILSEAS